MGDAHDRRWFLKRVPLLALVAPAGLVQGCGGGDARDREVESPSRVGESERRPVLLPYSDGAVRLPVPLTQLPMAYVSMGSRRIYVEYDFRDRVYWALRAHISVSTGVWRIPLPGDPERVPITPGDPMREFEELSLREWDPSAEPTEGDMRIRSGRRETHVIRFSCVPVGGTGAFLSAGPIEIGRCQPAGDEACREDFMSVATADRSSDRACAETSDTVRLMTWACR